MLGELRERVLKQKERWGATSVKQIVIACVRLGLQKMEEEPKDLHPSFKGTETGRMSARHPNQANTPRSA